LVEEVESLRDWHNAGLAINWDCHSFTHKVLFVELAKAEAEIENIRAMTMQAFLKGWFKSS